MLNLKMAGNFFLFYLLYSSLYANENISLLGNININNSKLIVLGKISQEIRVLRLRNKSRYLIKASLAQADCVKNISDVRFFSSDCKKIYKQTLFHERVLHATDSKKKLSHY